MLKHIPQSWKDDMRTNFAHKHDFYINPRGRVLPALTSAGISYIKNDATTNMRGTYRMQCGASTSLTYLYTLPKRFIIEGWFKPEFAYTVAAQDILNIPSGTAASAFYYSSSDAFAFTTTAGGTSDTMLTSPVFASDAELQHWIYVRCFFDNVAKLKGFYCTVNGVVYSDQQNVPAAGDFVPLNTLSWFLATSAESSYWIIHELDEALATGEYKTYQADRQIIFDFNGTTLGRERIRIPTIHTATEHRGVQSFSLSKSVENPMTGSAGANTASMKLLNVNGQFSDDQYDAFDPFNGRYNGTQKYLQNRVPVEIESGYSPTINVRDGLQGFWSFKADDETDNSGNGNDATITGALYTDTPYGRGLIGDGDDFVSLGGAYGSSDITMSIWAKITKGAAANQYLFYRPSTGVAGLFYLNTADAIVMRSRGSDVSTARDSSIPASSWTSDEWMHVAGVQSGLQTLVYLNGNLIDSDTHADICTSFITGMKCMGLNATTGCIQSGTISQPRIYNRALSASEVACLYSNYEDWGTISETEPLFIGRTTPGAFKRSSPSKFFGDVSINIEDGISELGETKLRRAYAFDAYDLCDPAAEGDSLVHSIARLVTKKEIRNYALNSSFENATIANSWTNSGMATFARSNTYAQFGTYSMQCVADAAAYKVTQVIKFETADLIDVGDVFNFSALIRQGTASTVKIQIEELTSAGALVGTASETACGTDTAVFTRVNVSRTILSSTCTQLRITFYAVAASTFYVDGVMLTRGIDPIDYFLLNATDGASGSGSADLAATCEYDTVAFDCDAVDVEHPYALVEKGQTAWDALKKIGDASIASYIGMSPDGVFNFRVRYNSADMPNMGDIEDFGGIATSLDVQGANAVKVHGVIIQNPELKTTTLWQGEGAAGFTTDEGGKLKHPISDATFMSVYGAEQIEMKYAEDV